MIRSFLVILFLLLPFAFAQAEDKVNVRDMEVACAIVNGKLNNGPECVKLEKKMVEEQCKKGDPNSCKALTVAKDGVDKDATYEKILKKEEKTPIKEPAKKKNKGRITNK